MSSGSNAVASSSFLKRGQSGIASSLPWPQPVPTRPVQAPQLTMPLLRQWPAGRTKRRHSVQDLRRLTLVVICLLSALSRAPIRAETVTIEEFVSIARALS